MLNQAFVDHSATREMRADQTVPGVRYYTGEPCRICSATFRYVMTRSCVACARAKARAKTADKREARRQRRLEACRRLGIGL